MQIIVNCLIPWKSGFVMLQKPRRGWWVLPGGKVETGELWTEAAIREVEEETGLVIQSVHLRGIHTHTIYESDSVVEKRRVIAQFVADGVTGTLLSEVREGILSLMTEQDVERLPMDEGDRLMLLHTLKAERTKENQLFFGDFTYNTNHELQSHRITPAGYL